MASKREFPTDIPAGILADLDQLQAEADRKYGEMVGLLRDMTGERGLYAAMAVMAASLEKAPQETLISMVLTGMAREMKHDD